MALLQDLKNRLNQSKQVFTKIAKSAYQNPGLNKVAAVGKKVGDIIGKINPITNSDLFQPAGPRGLTNTVANPLNPKSSVSTALDITSAAARGAVENTFKPVKNTTDILTSPARPLVGAVKGVAQRIKNPDYYSGKAVEDALKSKGVNPGLAFVGGLVTELVIPGVGGGEKKGGEKILQLTQDELKLIAGKYGDKTVEEVLKGKASKKVLNNIYDLVTKDRSVAEGIVKEAKGPMSIAEAKDYNASTIKDLNESINSIVTDAIKGEPVMNPKPQSLVEKEMLQKAVDGGFIPDPDPIKSVQNALADAANKNKEQENIYSATRGARFAEGFKARSTGGLEGFIGSKRAMEGEMEKVTTDALKNSLNQDAIKGLFDTLSSSKLNQGDYLNAGEGLQNLLDGKVPTASQLKLLNEVFPSDLVSKLVDNRAIVKKVIDAAGEVINVPRALVASADMSAPFRQGVFLAGRPKQFLPAFKDMFKYAFSEKAYKGLLEDIKSRPTYPLMEANKLAITDLGKLDSREEAFMTNLAEKIPGVGAIVKGSNRAYSGFLNKLRADVFDDLIRKGKSVGLDFDGKRGSDLARFINSATGRGDIGSLGDAAPLINGLLFSPRLMKSRLDLLNPVFYAKLDPFVRKEALKSLFTFAGMGATVLGIAKLGGAEVGDDPRSSDFGKIKVGDTRYDIWGGFQQYIKLASQLVTGELKSSTSGNVYKVGEGYKPITRLDLLYRFLEQKEAPVPSFVTGLLKGTTVTGESFDIPTELQNRVIPLVLQDLKDLYDEGGIESLSKSIPSFFGVGSQTYSNTSRGGAEPFKVRKITPKSSIQAKSNIIAK